jgi:DNA-binding transcriptional MerR regulator
MRDHRPQLLRIGDLARLTGKSARALHLYEELGLVEPATRSRGGFRLYEPVTVERVKWIELLNGLGFSLQEMRALLHSWWNAGLGPEAMDELRGLFTRKLEETRDNLRRQQQLEQELLDGLAYLETCRMCASPAGVRSCVHCAQDHGMNEEPALVAGLKSAPGVARSRPGGIVRVEEIE